MASDHHADILKNFAWSVLVQFAVSECY